MYQPDMVRRIVLTDGGWRWRLLAVGSNGTIALQRPFSDVLLFNRAHVAADRVTDGASIGGVHTLSGTIAHETVHLLKARRRGEWRLAQLPAWKQEGYADFVARETSVDPDGERRIRAINPGASVLRYYEERPRVAAMLARNGGSVDALFSD